MEEYSVDDPTQLLEAASDFASYPGFQNDASAKEFLDCFLLPVILNALQTKVDVPGLESTLVAVLERVFKTKYGASLIPQFVPFIQVGVMAESQEVKSLACKTVSCLLENLNEGSVSATHLILDRIIYPLLFDCLIHQILIHDNVFLLVFGNEKVATLAMDAIAKIAGSPEGIDIVFPANNKEATHLGALADQRSSVGRVRVLALIVKLFSVSANVASVVQKSNLLGLFEAEINNTNDTPSTLSILELLYELTEIEHGREFLSASTLLQLLSSIISNKSMESILRTRAMMISGRILSKENYILADELNLKTVLSAIERILSSSETQEIDECESALEALGQIGSCKQAALHALGNISGEIRSANSMILTSDAEESLRRLIYETASKSSKLTPSDLFLSVLKQDSEIRLAGYRMLSGLVARPWCLMEICSKQEITNIVTDPITETTKLGVYSFQWYPNYMIHSFGAQFSMEARYNCCKAIHIAFNMTSKLASDQSLSGIAAKLHDAVEMGPYLARKQLEAQPVVVTEDRFESNTSHRVQLMSLLFPHVAYKSLFRLTVEVCLTVNSELKYVKLERNLEFHIASKRILSSFSTNSSLKVDKSIVMKLAHNKGFKFRFI
ncbi:hypothetical protein D8674_005304 [Pyrus ussuriensis x Pyrus communis]|uniref:26S proteasome non-ATPase regulatory subunit 5 n=1 Tax=Pyrus ussuriensis x Pyrus communis TaxID=2448454 RepID=A0A5N5FRU2_9ROSA|nr:hypothetical protein D8674_005304 [Pyrus ussuriensis x Pyrus communis]